MAVSGVGLAYAAGGFVLFWSGLKNATLQQTLTAFLKGQQPPANLTGPPTIGVAQAASSTTPSTSSAAAAATLPGNTGAATASAAAAQTLARGLATAQGHPSWATGQLWADWVALWNRESGWSNTADTRKSGLDPPDATDFAYGIPQSRPYSKMPQAGWPPDKGGSADPVSQITWGIGYIAGTYGDPSGAWAHEVSNGWY